MNAAEITYSDSERDMGNWLQRGRRMNAAEMAEIDALADVSGLASTGPPHERGGDAIESAREQVRQWRFNGAAA